MGSTEKPSFVCLFTWKPPFPYNAQLNDQNNLVEGSSEGQSAPLWVHIA